MTAPLVTFDGENIPAKNLPIPSGYTVLLAPIHLEETTAGGIVLIKEELKSQEASRFVSKVLAIGPLAYKGDKFKEHPNAQARPFCKVGDIVVSGTYSGATLPCKDDKGNTYYLRFMNDDEIKMVMPNTEILDV